MADFSQDVGEMIGPIQAGGTCSKPLKSPHAHCACRMQAWSNIRADIAEQLRLPLCLALLKNCTSPYDEAYSLVS